MRRMCLDIECNLYLDSMSGWSTRDSTRAELAKKNDFRFYCAVVYDAARRRYYEFLRDGLDRMIERLRTADEIITVNGRGYDLPALERECGKQKIKPLWTLLRDINGSESCYGVEELSNKLLPGRFASFKLRERKHFARLRAKGMDDFLAGNMAKCRTDVEYTAAIMRRLPAEET